MQDISFFLFACREFTGMVLEAGGKDGGKGGGGAEQKGSLL